MNNAEIKGSHCPTIDEMLHFCCDMGRSLLKNSAEVHRVEETLTLVMKAYGYNNTEVFSIPNYLTVDIEHEGVINSKFVRIHSSVNNMNKLVELNNLSYAICRCGLSFDEASDTLYKIINEEGYSTKFLTIMGGAFALAFTVFWGGSLKDCIIATMAGLLSKYVYINLAKKKSTVCFNNVCSGFVLSILPVIVALMGLSFSFDKVMIGAIMLLVPGLGITNAIRDILSQDFITSVARFAEVIIVSLGMGLGISLPLIALRNIGNTVSYLGGLSSINFSVIASFFVCVIYSYLCELKSWKQIGPSSLCGLVGWIVYLLFEPYMGLFFSSLAGAVAVCLGAEAFARIFKCPATVFLVVGIIPMVPGGAIYNAIASLINSNIDMFVYYLGQVLIVSSAIAVGWALMSSLFRLMSYSKQSRIN